MASTKAALKAAKSAIDSHDYAEAVRQANIVLAADAQNYFGNVFLGRSLEKLGRPDEAISPYRTATRIKPDDELAWKGLCNLLESRSQHSVKEFIEVSARLADLYAEKDDVEQCQTVVDKLVGHAKANGSRDDYRLALEVLLPTSSVYGFLEGRIQRPALTYTRLAELAEVDEKERINKEIGERRTRLGAKIGQVTSDVTREVYRGSRLEDLYQNVIDWTNDDDQRREYEEKLLKRAYDNLMVLPSGEKADKRAQVIKLAHDMVIIKHPSQLAWRLELEWTDMEELSHWDFGVLREYVELFPGLGLARVIKAFLGEEVVHNPKTDDEHDSNGEDLTKRVPLSADDRLLLMTDGIDDCKDSAIAHRIVGDFYLGLEEYESCMETSRQGLKLLQTESQQSGLRLDHNKDAVASNLATCLVYYQSPKNHPEAKTLFDSILERKPNFTTALLGIGLIYEEETDFEKASNFLDRALERDPNNVRIGTEAAWCQALTGHTEEGLRKLKTYEADLKVNDSQARTLKAQTLYRIGRCTWDLNTDRAARKDRQGAYAYFLAAVRTNPAFASAYHNLGIYYADYAKDKKRARQCFQKAFELSATEVEAAERLARHFADEGDWDIVEMVAQRVIDSGVAKPSPGSKRKGVDWPFAAVGIVQMNKQEYAKSVISFQAAIRISPDNYHAWVGLGESYHSSGRYNAAQRTLEHAQTLGSNDPSIKDTETWFARYMLANVHRELGDYAKAIQGYKEVLELRSDESGVTMSLLQTWLEKALVEVETGFFGQASASANQALSAAKEMLNIHSNSFNFWKCVADACAVFSWIPGRIKDLPSEIVLDILRHDGARDSYEVLSDVDNVSFTQIDVPQTNGDTVEAAPSLEPLLPALLAHKRAIMAASSDIHAQAVAWYNLGWAEQRAHMCITSNIAEPGATKSSRYARAAVRAFKRAIELEAGNADFWSALGVVTTSLNPAVAQHSFVRSLNLNERSARTWTNLGVLYLLQDDTDLAHHAFSRAQSTDPQYAHAWLGEGLIAALLGDAREALSHFTHALEIGDASSVPVKQHYVLAAFDALLASPTSSTTDISTLISPLFALLQLHTQSPPSVSPAYAHLSALLTERIDPTSPTILAHLLSATASAESTYEAVESSQALRNYILSITALARAHLAAFDYSAATAAAETVLDLTATPDDAALPPPSRARARLSAHLTAALAAYHSSPTTTGPAAALSLLSAASSETPDPSPDLTCLHAQLLLADPNPDIPAAQDLLLAAAETHPTHARVTALLGASAALSGDVDTLDAVIADLQPTTSAQTTSLLARLADASLSRDDAAADVAAAVMLAPHEPRGWSRLARDSGDAGAGDMARLTAAGAAREARVGAEEVAGAFAGEGARTAADAQRAVVLAPWGVEGWRALGECVC